MVQGHGKALTRYVDDRSGDFALRSEQVEGRAALDRCDKLRLLLDKMEEAT